MSGRGGYARSQARPTVWVQADSGAAVTDRGRSLSLPIVPAPGGGLLARVPTGAGTYRVYVVGVPPGGIWTQWARDTLAAAAAAGDGWSVSPRGHHLINPARPVCRFRNSITDTTIEVRSAGEWFGDDVDASGATVYTVADARAAAELLGRKLGDAFGPGGMLRGSPGYTGRVLAQLGGDAFGEPLPAELRELVSIIGWQGRRQLLADPDRKRLPGFAYVDARTAYGACTRELGIGPGEHHERLRDLPLDARGKLTARGWLLVEATVPRDWSHVGLLGRVPGPSPIHYPSKPGELFQCWAGTGEVALALAQGWKIRVREGLLLTQGKPLDLWRSRLERIWRELSDPRGPYAADVPIAAQLAAGGVGRIVRESIGGFAHTGTVDTRYYTDPGEIPAGVRFDQLADGTWVTETRRPVTDPLGQRPELAAQIWARARTRLLAAPGGTGALSIPRDRLLAFRTDAIWATVDPRWPDPGGWGAYRLKGLWPRPVATPRDEAGWVALRRKSETELDRLRGADHG